MNREFLTDLFRQTLNDPRGAAARLLRMDVQLSDLLRAAGLVTVLNTIVFSLSLALFGGSDVPGLFASPFTYATVMFAGLIVYGGLVGFTGRSLGGEGRFADVLVMLVWLQAMRVVAQVIVPVLAVLLPFLSAPAAIAIGLFGIWLTLNMIAEAHGFEHLGRAFLAALLAGMGLVVALIMLLTLLGVAPPQPI